MSLDCFQMMQEEVKMAQQKADIEKLHAARHDTGTWQTETGEIPLKLTQETLVHELHESQAQVEMVALLV